MKLTTLLAVLVSLVLPGCGFEPLYGERGDVSVTSELSSVHIAAIPDRAGQVLRNFLLDQINPRGERDRAYTLTIDLREPQQEIGILRSDTATRIAYSAIASYTLADGGGRPLLRGQSTSNTTYQLSNSPFSTLASRFDSRDRALQEISIDIRHQLAAFFLDQARKQR
jgi:LPS-assembly lipoprotein